MSISEPWKGSDREQMVFFSKLSHWHEGWIRRVRVLIEADTLEVSQGVVPPGGKEAMDLQIILNLMASELRDSLYAGA